MHSSLLWLVVVNNIASSLTLSWLMPWANFWETLHCNICFSVWLNVLTNLQVCCLQTYSPELFLALRSGTQGVNSIYLEEPAPFCVPLVFFHWVTTHASSYAWLLCFSPPILTSTFQTTIPSITLKSGAGWSQLIMSLVHSGFTSTNHRITQFQFDPNFHRHFETT